MNGVVVVDGTEIARFMRDMRAGESHKQQLLAERTIEDFLVWRFRQPKKAKGPAATGIAPDHGSTNPTKEMAMNAKTDTTAPAASASATPLDFPIPYEMQGPYDDLRDALALLSLLDAYFDDGWKHGIDKDVVADMSVAFSTACSNIRLVVAFLNEDERAGTLDLYRRVRRQEIVGGRA